jgi:ribose transport system ATP-binding protein
MPEVLHVADRIYAMFQGQITQEFTSEDVTEDNLVRAISGLSDNGSTQVA